MLSSLSLSLKLLTSMKIILSEIKIYPEKNFVDLGLFMLTVLYKSEAVEIIVFSWLTFWSGTSWALTGW